MIITCKTMRYNARRYGNPWIAMVTFDDAGVAKYNWGQWIGTFDRSNGSDGLLVINVENGDIVATGQKDYRRSSNTIKYYLVEYGTLVDLAGGKVEAYRIYHGK